MKSATTISSAEADVAAAAAAAKKTGEQSALTGALKIEDEPCVVMMSATGLIARTTPSAMDVFNSRSASDERLHDDQITTIFRTSTRATYGLVTSAGRWCWHMWSICRPCRRPPRFLCRAESRPTT